VVGVASPSDGSGCGEPALHSEGMKGIPMARNQIQIKCINKDDRKNPYERITHVGGVDSTGKSWRIPQEAAITHIESANGRSGLKYRGEILSGLKWLEADSATNTSRRKMTATSQTTCSASRSVPRHERAAPNIARESFRLYGGDTHASNEQAERQRANPYRPALRASINLESGVPWQSTSGGR